VPSPPSADPGRSDDCRREPGCRACGSAALEVVLDFGEVPLPEVLLTEERRDDPVIAFPLRLAVCEDCSLVQLTDTVSPEILYGGDYPYFSSVVQTLVDHFGASAGRLMRDRRLGPDSLVVEAASNDGCMLGFFAREGIPVLGIDPARGPAEVAERAGVPTIVDFFDLRRARMLREEGRLADVLLGNNVLNLAGDLGDFAQAMSAVMAPDGVAVLEVPYVVALIDKRAFDNVFHANLSYFSATALDRLMRRHGLGLVAVERIPTFGGSLRATIARDAVPGPSAEAILATEAAAGVGSADYYRDFAARVLELRDSLTQLLSDLRGQGRTVCAYGAAGGMATTLLGFLGLDDRTIAFAVDGNPHKQGRYTMGSRLLVSPPERLVTDRPDYALLLAWNYADEILAANAEYRRAGGRFIIPIPEPRVI